MTERRTVMYPTQERLQELFDYDQKTGLVTRAKTVAANAKKGDNVGCISSKGYLRAQVDMKLYYLHRLIWIYCSGNIPKIIDHINGDKLDNRLDNLRDTTNANNSKNMALRFDNKSGISGVYFMKDRGKWVAEIYADGRKKWLGSFGGLDEAVLARKSAEKEYGFHENHNRVRN